MTTVTLELDKASCQKEKSPKGRHENQRPSGVPQKHWAKSYNIYSEDGAQTCVGPVLAVSDSAFTGALKKHSLKAGRLRLSCHLSLSTNIFSLQRWPAMTLPDSFSLYQNSKLCSFTRTSQKLEKHPQWLSLFKNPEWRCLCLLHILRHTSLLVKRHSMCPYLLFAVNRGRTKQFTESMFVVALHWNGARILENKYSAKQTRHLRCWLITDPVIWNTDIYSPKTLEHKHTIQYPGDPIRCTDLNGLLCDNWSSSRL